MKTRTASNSGITFKGINFEPAINNSANIKRELLSKKVIQHAGHFYDIYIKKAPSKKNTNLFIATINKLGEMNKHKGFFNWVFKSTELNNNNITAVEQMERKVQEGLFDGVFKRHIKKTENIKESVKNEDIIRELCTLTSMYRKTRLSSYLPEITVHLDSRFSDPIVNYGPIKQKNNLVNDINTYINLKNLEAIIQKKINNAETNVSEKYKKAELSIANILH